MKKRMLFILCIGMLIGVMGCKDMQSDINIPIDSVDKEKFMLGYTLDGGRFLSLTYEVPYVDENSTEKYLGEAIFKNVLTIEDVIKDLDFVDALKDGGSKLYKYSNNTKKYGDKDFYMMVCNSIDKNNNIFVAQNRTLLNNVCSFNVDDIQGVTMSIKRDTLNNKGATVIIKDDSGRENIYGDDYKLQIYKNENWEDLTAKTELIFNTIGYTIEKGKTKEFEIDWFNTYGSLKNGKYRILKSVGEVGEGAEHHISVEFTI